jgi:hypothetical protein
MDMQSAVIEDVSYFYAPSVDFLQIVSAEPFHFYKTEAELLNPRERLECVIDAVRIAELKNSIKVTDTNAHGWFLSGVWRSVAVRL